VRILQEVREGDEGSGVNGETDKQGKEDGSGMAGEQEPHSSHNPRFVSIVNRVLVQHAAEFGRQGVGVLQGDRSIARNPTASIRESLAGAPGA
jgi:hypothetical protein